MQPIFSRTGGTVGWLNDGAVLDCARRYRALIVSEAVYSYEGRFLGWLKKGYFRDGAGHAVAFMKGAVGGPVPPIPALPPRPPLVDAVPIHSPPPLPPFPPILSFLWSDWDWESFLAGFRSPPAGEIADIETEPSAEE